MRRAEAGERGKGREEWGGKDMMGEGVMSLLPERKNQIMNEVEAEQEMQEMPRSLASRCVEFSSIGRGM